MQIKAFYMALLIVLLLLVLMELRLYSSVEYFRLGFLCLTGLPATPSSLVSLCRTWWVRWECLGGDGVERPPVPKGDPS
jgi:hypothetical protein